MTSCLGRMFFFLNFGKLVKMEKLKELSDIKDGMKK